MPWFFKRPLCSQQGIFKRPLCSQQGTAIRPHRQFKSSPNSGSHGCQLLTVAATDSQRVAHMPEQQDDAASTSASPVPSADPPPQQSTSKAKQKKEYRQIQMPTPEQIVQEDMMNNCGVRTVMSGVMGMGLGVLFGVVMGTMDAGGAGFDGNLAPTADAPKQTTRQVFRQMLLTARSRSWTYAKGFGAVGALFAGSECVIEKTRAKHDIYNSVYAGCFAGGALAASAGPKAACAGCVTFGAFSAVIDKFLEQP